MVVGVIACVCLLFVSGEPIQLHTVTDDQSKVMTRGRSPPTRVSNPATGHAKTHASSSNKSEVDDPSSLRDQSPKTAVPASAFEVPDFTTIEKAEKEAAEAYNPGIPASIRPTAVRGVAPGHLGKIRRLAVVENDNDQEGKAAPTDKHNTAAVLPSLKQPTRMDNGQTRLPTTSMSPKLPDLFAMPNAAKRELEQALHDARVSNAAPVNAVSD